MFEPLSCYYGLAELPDLTHKSVPQLWRIYRRAIKKNMPPLEEYADYLDLDIVWWIAFNIQVRLFDALPYDSTCLLQESIRAMAYSWGNKDEELTDWAKSFPSEIMNFLRSPMRPAKAVEAEQSLLNTCLSVTYWLTGNHVLEIPIGGFKSIADARIFGKSAKSLSRRVKGCSIFTVSGEESRECSGDQVKILSFREGGNRRHSSWSAADLVVTSMSVPDLSLAGELSGEYELLHSSERST